MLQPRICLLGLLPFRPIIRIGCRPAPAECGLDRPAARARHGVRMTRLHGSAVLGSVRLSLERGDLEPGPVGAPGTSTACLVVSSPPRLPWASKDARTSPTSSLLRGPLRVRVGKARTEHNESAVPLIAEFVGALGHFRLGPIAAVFGIRLERPQECAGPRCLAPELGGSGRGSRSDRETLCRHRLSRLTAGGHSGSLASRYDDRACGLRGRSPPYSPSPLRRRRGKQHYDNRRAVGAALRGGNRSRASGVRR
jgi:hypothetical protein